MTKAVVLAGALDTKSADYTFIRDLLHAQGLETLLVDFGVLHDPALTPDISADEVARAGGSSLAALRAQSDKTHAMRTMRAGLVATVRDLHAAGRIAGILALGGGGGTALATTAMQELPLGVPKLMVSTVAAGDVGAYVGTRDITMMHSVVDVAGLNRISRHIYANAAAAMAGMVQQPAMEDDADKPIITASMFGNTTACVTHAQHLLEAAGYEVLIFHATGSGGRTMESLLADGFATGNLDLTTTELADDLCGGVLSAGPDRLMAAARQGTPTVLAPGCLDMVNFWARGTVPAKYQDRLLYEWNSNITLMRTTVEENRILGTRIAEAANAAVGPVAILLPLGGVSQLDSAGGAFWDLEADGACFEAIRAQLKPGIPLHEMGENINDPAFAARAVALLTEMLDNR